MLIIYLVHVIIKKINKFKYFILMNKFFNNLIYIKHFSYEKLLIYFY